MHKFLFLIIFFFCFIPLCGVEKPLAERDIQPIMEEIFNKHVRQKKMNEETLLNGIQAYVDEFDPERHYLLKNESEEISQQSKAEVAALLADYQKGDFSYFKKLDQLFVDKIVRAKELRLRLYEHLLKFEKEFVALLETAPLEDGSGFVASEEELFLRWKNGLHFFLFKEGKRLGRARILSQKESMLKRFEESYTQIEKNWDTAKMKPAERQNIFSLQVLKALASSLDSHTRIFNPTEAESLRRKLEKGFRGIGVVLETSPKGGVIIKEVLPDSPAEKSGLVKKEDRIIEVAGIEIKGLTLKEIVQKIHEEAGELLRLKLIREVQGQERTLAIEIPTKVIPLPDQRLQIDEIPYGNGIIGAIRLDSFYQSDSGGSADEEMKQAIERLEKKGLRGLVLDLRYNSGGFLNQAVKIAGLFITNGVIVISKYSDGAEKVYRDLDPRQQYQGPLVVLVSRQTASAAEIVAEALQDWGVAVIVGDARTYGKGTIQSQTVTEEGASSFFKVTVGTYYTVSGKTPQLTGVMSDIEVPGPLSFEKIGEAFLDKPLPGGKIAAEYEDSLEDVVGETRDWYLHYYLPSIQKKGDSLQFLKPRLQSDSRARINNNPIYSNYLKKLSKNERLTPSQEAEVENQQFQEAIEIMKEMIYLESKESRKTIDQNSGAVYDAVHSVAR